MTVTWLFGCVVLVSAMRCARHSVEYCISAPQRLPRVANDMAAEGNPVEAVPPPAPEGVGFAWAPPPPPKHPPPGAAAAGEVGAAGPPPEAQPLDRVQASRALPGSAHPCSDPRARARAGGRGARGSQERAELGNAAPT